MQHHWDINKNESKLNLFLCGSIFSMMHKIFENSKEPLFGRADNRIHLKPFQVSVLKQILKENNPAFTPDDLLALYTFTGGVAKYIQLFVDNRALTLESMIDFMTEENSPFIHEGRTLLIEEFGKDYNIYFSILATISQGNNSRSQMENALHQEIGGGYLTRLEKDYNIIAKLRPLFSKSETKNIKYVIIDNFLTFWFRFFYKYSHFIESGSLGELKRIILRDYSTFSGKMLERYFWDKEIEAGRSTIVGGYWDKKGNNEIDLIALNEIDKTAMIAEIKCNPANYRPEKLSGKVTALKLSESQLQNYQIEYKCLSLNDM
jgi:AAA+ ATPase superfamily predicted ATPase